jgi:hypothetical protein
MKGLGVEGIVKFIIWATTNSGTREVDRGDSGQAQRKKGAEIVFFLPTGLASEVRQQDMLL